MPTERKTTAKTTETETGAMVRQSHGGALRNGGTNRGGPGRPPSKLRAICRKMAGTRLQVLGEISSKKSNAKNADKIRAIDVLLRYGMDRSIDIADVRDALHEMSELAYEMLPKEQADAFLAACGPIFKRL
jgi:hypothetical protein